MATKKETAAAFIDISNEQVERGKHKNDLTRRPEQRDREKERVSEGCYLSGYFSILFSIFLSEVPILLTLKRTQRSESSVVEVS